MRRDLTRKEFIRKMKRRGFVPSAFGYWRLPEPLENWKISELNGGETLRDRLAYLINRAKQIEERNSCPKK